MILMNLSTRYNILHINTLPPPLRKNARKMHAGKCLNIFSFNLILMRIQNYCNYEKSYFIFIILFIFSA